MEGPVYPATFEEKIGFSQVRQLITGECLSETGREAVQHITFSTSLEHISQEMQRTGEFMRIIQEGLPFPAQDYLDLIPMLLRLKTPGSYIQAEEMHDLRVSLNTIYAAVTFLLKAEKAAYPALRELAAGIDMPTHVVPGIDKILDEKGVVRSSASEKLAKIRKDIRARATASEKAMLSLLSTARANGWVSPDAEPTLRDGRLVIPVLAAHKRRIRGLIHDESATGQTVYLEPDECFELNNEVRNLENAEKREIIRILTHFTEELRLDIPALVNAHRFIGLIDSIRARARFSLRIGSQIPALNAKPVIRWENARHPLLFLAHQAKGRDVVPLDIRLEPPGRILVISGPNAGGKSVCLKTVGLLQYMIQCGLPVPMDSRSEAGTFHQLFLEIGDEQSLENDLSTYSSHLLHIRHFLENSGPGTLFLIDEFGSGTDPTLGGAIAEAALEKLNEKKAFGVVTTHYSNLKVLAGNVEGISNGAMLFDTNELRPLYQLAIGNPGSSFTYEIARKTGFPDEVINSALKKTGKTHLDFEKQLQALEVEKREIDKKKEEFTVADTFLDELIGRYEKMKAELENSRKKILEEAREQAAAMLEESNRLIERTIKEIRESAAEKEKTKEVRKVLEQEKKKLSSERKAQPEKERDTKMPSFRTGDWVTISGQDRTGKVLEVRGKEITVDFNGIRFTLKAAQLEPAKAPRENQPAGARRLGFGEELQEKSAHFKLTLDLRGKPAEEALLLARKYLDDAYLLRIHEVSILHGKGGGILRKVIRDMLSKAEEVESFTDEHIERGGSGITKVFLK